MYIRIYMYICIYVQGIEFRALIPLDKNKKLSGWQLAGHLGFLNFPTLGQPICKSMCVYRVLKIQGLGFPKIRATFLEVSMRRIIVFWGCMRGPQFWEGLFDRACD